MWWYGSCKCNSISSKVYRQVIGITWAAAAQAMATIVLCSLEVCMQRSIALHLGKRGQLSIKLLQSST